MVKTYNDKEIDKLVRILKNNGVISVPTDTLYGLCGIISSKEAYDKLIDIKGRDKSKSFPVMCSDIKQIEGIAVVNDVAREIINKFMPGPITIVLKKKDNIDDWVTNGKDTIAIRMATSKTLEELIKKVNCPLFMTSANKSGESPCINIDEIKESCPSIDGILEGKVIFGQGSTIIDCTTNNIKILREGPITLEQILNSKE